MGFDVYGIKELEDGKENYFRHTCWAWRPLWDVCYFLQSITKEQYEQGAYNDGNLIDEETSMKIYEKLTLFLNSPLRDDIIKSINERYEHHITNVDNVKVFSEFCKTSGGFHIW